MYMYEHLYENMHIHTYGLLCVFTVQWWHLDDGGEFVLQVGLPLTEKRMEGPVLLGHTVSVYVCMHACMCVCLYVRMLVYL